MSFKISQESNLIWENEKGDWHREKGPAVISPDGDIFYYFNDKPHREDGPATIFSCGKLEYWNNGEYLNRKSTRLKGNGS